MAAAHRRLIIVVDGTTELSSCWSKIFSECIQKIIRIFYEKSTEQEAENGTFELGFVLYNANSHLGFDLQSIKWTRNVVTFLGTLSSLSFNGDNLDQYLMAEGLAEALMMYTKPFNGSSSNEDYYYDGEKHCVLVSAGNPVPMKTLVAVPMVVDGKIALDRLHHNIQADFLEVSQLFSKLAVSLSVISPNQNAIFGEIFNLGNNSSEMAYDPHCNYKVGQLFVMLSRNFKEAHEAIHGKRVENSSEMITNLQSMKPSDITQSEIFNHDFQVMYGDIMPEMDAMNDILQPPFDDVHYSLGQLHTNSTMRMVSMDALKTIETGFGRTLEGTSISQNALGNENHVIDLTKDDDEVQVPPMALPEVSTAAAAATAITTNTSRVRSQNGLQLGQPRDNNNPWVFMFTSLNHSSSDILPNQNSSTLWPTTQPSWIRGLEHGNVSTEIRSGNSAQAEPENQPENGFGNNLFQHLPQNSVGDNKFQLLTSSPRVNNVYHEVNNAQVAGLLMAPFSSQYTLNDVQGNETNTTSRAPPISGIPKVTQWESLLPPPPYVMDFSDYVQAWEGYLRGKIQSSNRFINSAKAFKKATSTSMLTQWLDRLDISLFIPERAINHTQSIYHYNVEYVLFQIIQHTTPELHNYLKGANMCAKIELPSNTLILSPTESELFYVGIIFPQAVIFVEQQE